MPPTQPYAQPAPGQPAYYNNNVMVARPPSASVNIGDVLIHVGILQAVVNVVGFTIGWLVATFGPRTGASITTLQATALLLVLVFGTMVAIIAFFLFGLRVNPAVRWRHLSLVALGTVILTLLVNSILLQQAIQPASVVFAFIQTFFAVGVGGGLSMIFNRNQPAPQFAPQPAPPQYINGAWPNAPQQAPQYPPQGAPWYPGAPNPPAQPGYGQQPPQNPPQAPSGWGQQPGPQQGAQPQQPMYPVPQYPPNQQQGNQGPTNL